MFLESILFLQKLKISTTKKTVLPCFGNSIAGHPSSMPQSRGIYRDFSGSACDSLASETSSREKHLENFSKLLAWSVLAGVSGNYLATYLSREKRVFCIVRVVFKIFFSFPLNFMWLFIFSFIWNFPNTSCNQLRTPLLLHFFSKSSRKGMGLLFLTSCSMFCVLFSCLLSRYCIRTFYS